MGTYTIRDLDDKTKEVVHHYAQEHDLNIADAIRELVFLALQHLQHSKKEKKYGSFFEMYDKIKFKGGANLSKEHDKVAYEL